MWCLETIIELNQAVATNPSTAYQKCRIKLGTHSTKEIKNKVRVKLKENKNNLKFV